MRRSASRFQVAGRMAKVALYQLNGPTYYGQFYRAIDNQTISANYHNSMEARFVAFASATYLRTQENSNYNSLQVSAERRARESPTASPILMPNRWMTSLLSGTLAIRLVPMVSRLDMRHNFVASYNWTLPFAAFSAPTGLTEGGTITGISRFNTGFPSA